MRNKCSKPVAEEQRRKFIVEPLEPRTLFSADVVSASLALDLLADNSLEQHNWQAQNALSEFAVSKDKADLYPIENSDLHRQAASLLQEAEARDNRSDLVGFENQAAEVLVEQNPAFEHSRQLIVIDARVNDSKALLKDIINNGQSTTDFEIIWLDKSSDGINTITSALSAHNDQQYNAVHIITHGSDAHLQLGATQLNNANLQQHQAALSSWGSGLSHNADILFYGCDVAQTHEGQEFVDQISQWTGADIASSTDLTGHTDLGGNWELEYVVGNVETDLAFSLEAQHNWMETLGTITVTTLMDVDDGVTTSITELMMNPGDDGKISLREAIIAANADATPDTIILGSGPYELSITGGGEQVGDLNINTDIEIIGAANGSTTIDATAINDRVFNIDNNANAVISNLTVTGGSPTSGGGGIFVAFGASLDLDNVIITENTSSQGGGVRSLGTLNITNSEITGNTSTSNGGGVSSDGLAEFDNVIISDNESSNTGGGIRNFGTLNITNSTIASNNADNHGGGISNNGDLGLTNVTISGNFTLAHGGGLHITAGMSVFENLTVSGNSANIGDGGGLFINNVSVSLDSATVTNNFAGRGGGVFVTNDGGFNITNSIVAGNAATDESRIEVRGTIQSDGTNIIGDDTDDSDGGNGYDPLDLLDQTGLLLGPLADNGGPVQTHALQPGSVGINPNGPNIGASNSVVVSPLDLSGGIELNTNGGNDAYLLSQTGLPQDLTETTVEVRFRADQAQNGTEPTFISYHSGTEDEFTVSLNAPEGGLELNFGSGGSVAQVVATSIDYWATLLDGNIHTLSTTWDNTNGDWAVYIDGEFIESGTGFQPGETLATTTGRFSFGQQQDGLNSGYDVNQRLSGTFYDVRIWNQARTAAEIALGYQTKVVPRSMPEGLIANWQMDGFNGSNEVVDVIGDNNLTVENVAAGTGFLSGGVALDALNVAENSANGTSVGYVVASGLDIYHDVLADGQFTEAPHPTIETTYSNGDLFGGWEVTGGSVDLLPDSILGPNDSLVLDLSGHGAGTIVSSEITTVPGQTYEARFAVNGNFAGGNQVSKDFQVSVDGTSHDLSLVSDGSPGWDNVQWEYRTIVFIASSNSTTLSFQSMDNSAFGLLLADVSVVAQPDAVSTLQVNDSELIYNAASNKFYKYFATPEVFTDAQITASNAMLSGVAGRLVTIGNPTENQFVADLIAAQGINDVHLGASDADVEGEWRWIHNGEQFSDGFGVSVNGAFVGWNMGEPNDSGNQDFAAINKNGEWNDINATRTLGSIVEWDASEVLASLAYSLTDNANGRFTIDSNSGEISVTDDTQLDYEADTSHTVTVEATDATGHSYQEDFTIEVQNVNEKPTFTGLDNNPLFFEGGSPVVLDSNVTILDPELSSVDNFDGSTIYIGRAGTAAAEDIFSATGQLGPLIEGGSIDYNGVSPGDVIRNNGGELILQFNALATNALVNSVLQSIAYANASNTPDATVDLNWTFNDVNGLGNQGSGPEQLASYNMLVNIIQANIAPEITGASTSVMTPFINEIHYDNTGVDENEAVEIVAAAGTDLTGWTLVRYSGTNGKDYGTDPLSGVVADQGKGYGTFVINYALGGLQNGNPHGDALALVDNLGTAIQFISYEEVAVTAVEGPAAGMTATLLDVHEPPFAAKGTSLQLTDSGWSSGQLETFGGENVGQDFDNLSANLSALIAEDSPLTFSASSGNPITVQDIDANGSELEVRLQVNNGSLALGGTSGLNGLTGDGTNTITFTATIADINEALDGLTYTGSPNFNGNDLLTIDVDDQGNTGSGGAMTATGSIDITVNASNDAPALDTSATLIVPNVDEGDLNPAGDTVANIVASDGLNSITDVDIGDAEGIAVYTVDDTNGVWQYSLAGVSGWTGIGAVNTASALLLDPAAEIRFVPDPDFTGTAKFFFHAWDQTQGTSGQPFDITNTGDSSPFSLTSDDVTVTVDPVNDAPILATGSNPHLDTITEDDTDNPGETVASLLAKLGDPITDVDAGAVEGIAIFVNNSNNGQWQYSTDAGTNWQNVGAVSPTNALLLRDIDLVRMEPDGKLGHTANFGFRAWDQTVGAAGTTVNIPALGSTGGTSAFSNNTLSAQISVSNINDDPYNVSLPGDQTVTEDISTPVDLSAVEFTDVDDLGQLMTVRLTTASSIGLINAATQTGIQITSNGTGLVTLSGTKDDLNAYFNNPGNISYLHSIPNTFGDNKDTIGIELSDNGNTGSGGGGFVGFGFVNIDIAPVNDNPVAGGFQETYLTDLTPLFRDKVVAYEPNSAYQSAAIVLDGQEFYHGLGTHPGVGIGILEYDLNGATNFSAIIGLNETLADAGEVNFRVYMDNVEVFNSGTVTNATQAMPVSINTSGGDVLRLEVDSLGSNGGDHAVWADAKLSNAATQPTTISIAETAINSTVVGTYSGSDPDTTDSLTYTLLNDARGRFGIDENSGEITVTDASQLDYETTKFHTVSVRIDDGTTSTDHNVRINLSEVNESPTGANNTVTIDEDTPYTFKDSDFGYSDAVGENNIFEAILIRSLPTMGTLTLNNVPVDMGDVVNVSQFSVFNYTPAPEASGNNFDSFDFSVRDNRKLVADIVNTLIFDVAEVNDPPTSTPVVLAPVIEDNARVITQTELLANAHDIEGDPLVASALTINTGNGTLTDNTDGTWSYTPASNDDTDLSFNYTIDDGTNTITESATLDITPVNSPPTSTPVVLTPVIEDNARVITQTELLANATDIEGDTLLASGLTINTGNGTLTDNADDTWSHTPATNDDTDVSFTYTIDDGTNSIIESATLDITPVNDAPASTPVALTPAVEDNTRLITQAELLANATDIEGNTLTATGLTITAGHGTLIDNDDGTWSYAPDNNDDTDADFTYTVSDSVNTIIESATLDIIPVNDAPTLTKNNFTIIEGEPLLITTTELDATDTDSTDLSYSVSNVNNGQFVLSSDPTVAITTFTQAQIAANEILFIHNGSELAPAFGITVSDIAGNSTIAPGNISFTPVNDDPLNAGTLPADLTALEDIQTVVDTSTIVISDSDIGSGNLSLYISTVSGTLQATNTTGLTVSGNDTDNLLLSGALPLINAWLNDTTSLSYTGDANVNAVYNGSPTDTISFAISDNGNAGTGSGSDISVGSSDVDITSVNDAPIGANNTVTTPEDTDLTFALSDFNFSDTIDDNTFLAVTIDALPSNGQLLMNGTAVASGDIVLAADIDAGLLIFQPDTDVSGPNNAEILFRVQDDGGTSNNGSDTDTTARTLTIDLTPVNDSPMLVSNGATVLEGGTVVIDDTSLHGLDPDDTDPDELVLTVTTVPAHGQLLLNGDIVTAGTSLTLAAIESGSLSYIHDSSETSADGFNVALADGGEDGALPAQGRFKLDVTEVIDPPVELMPDSLQLAFGESFDSAQGNVLASGFSSLNNGSLSNNTSLLVELEVPPSHGTVKLQADGTFTYVHNGSMMFNDEFSYRVTNEDGVFTIATVAIMIEPPMIEELEAVIEEPMVEEPMVQEPMVEEPLVEEPEIAPALEPVPDPVDNFIESIAEQMVTTTPTTEESTEQEVVQSNEEPAQDAQPNENIAPLRIDNSPAETRRTSILSQVETQELPEINLLQTDLSILESLAVTQHRDIVSLAEISELQVSSAGTYDITLDLHIPTPKISASNPSFLRGLEQIENDFLEQEKQNGTRYQFAEDAILGASFSVSVGALAWLLRGGALFGSMMTFTPLWKFIEIGQVTVMIGRSKGDDDETTSEEDDRIESLFEESDE